MITSIEIQERVAKELDIKESIVDEVNRVQYEFCVSTMKEGTSGFKIIHIGKWIKKNRKPFRKLQHDSYIKSHN